ncbi:hypothetical protein [Natronobeatus ordinarius]|uniref:hypothetical protein n=1 Tax=Natronobeatus ordinarius TaxID=2963433 RepID=UPI0020CB8DA5|nr:hypothetical protein [Natronobeatus ordinarius]
MLEEPILTADAEVGFCHELRGDFRLVGDLGGHEDEYAIAAEQYETVENDLGWSSEPYIEDAIIVPVELADSVGFTLGEDERNRIMYLSLEDRIEYKRNQFPEIIDRVIENGNWDSEFV